MTLRIVLFLVYSLSLSLVGCARPQSYATDVQPVLHKHCLSCHQSGGKGHEASGFSVESYADLMRGTKYGPVVVPGDSVSSTLMLLAEHKADRVLNMPQGKARIPAAELAAIGLWIDQGAENN